MKKSYEICGPHTTNSIPVGYNKDIPNKYQDGHVEMHIIVSLLTLGAPERGISGSQVGNRYGGMAQLQNCAIVMLHRTRVPLDVVI